MRIRLFALVLSILTLLALSGCVSTEAPPQLLNVLDFAPREAEVGDRLEVIGAGFPEGKTAHVIFKGSLYRPGQKAIKGVEIDVDAANSSSDKIDMMFTEGLEAQFCGAGDAATHTTFKGSVIVSFPAGIDTGHRLRVPGQGMPGRSGAGDLYVDIEVTADDRFERHRAELG